MDLDLVMVGYLLVIMATTLNHGAFTGFLNVCRFG